MAEYIEREAAIRAILNDYPEQVGYSREDAADCIRYIIASDVASVRHGKLVEAWIHGIEHYRCTECGEYIEGVWLSNFYYNYCPNCGAKMLDLEG